MHASWPGVSRSSPAAAQRCAAGAGLDGDLHGQGTISRAVRCGATNQHIPNYPQFPPGNQRERHMILANLMVGFSVMWMCLIVQAAVAFWSVRYYVRQSSNATAPP